MRSGLAQRGCSATPCVQCCQCLTTAIGVRLYFPPLPLHSPRSTSRYVRPHSVTIDKDDNVWLVDDMANMLTKCDGNGTCTAPCMRGCVCVHAVLTTTICQGAHATTNSTATPINSTTEHTCAHARTHARTHSRAHARAVGVAFFFRAFSSFRTIASCNSANANTESMQYHAHSTMTHHYHTTL